MSGEPGGIKPHDPSGLFALALFLNSETERGIVSNHIYRPTVYLDRIGPSRAHAVTARS